MTIAMMLFDLGSLQHSPDLSQIILVTEDGFASSAAACLDYRQVNPNSGSAGSIEAERQYYCREGGGYSLMFKKDSRQAFDSEASRLTTVDDHPRQPSFRWVLTCSECARLLGRVTF